MLAGLLDAFAHSLHAWELRISQPQVGAIVTDINSENQGLSFV